ncbi:MAG: energy transducer TonB [Candidatus Kapabacteria bacterium]|jgi:TonB family protein|nr:energy transducer TonB [Candidatus Kapabacteria bacterium]
MTNIAIEIPQRSDYGAIEIKEYINKATVKGFYASLTILLIILIAYFAMDFVGTKKVKLKAPIATGLVDIAPPPEVEVDVAPPPEVQVVNNSVARAGTPNPVPDSEILADAPDYASMMDQSVSDAKGGGTGLDLTTFNFDEGNNNSNVQVREQESDPDDFVAVEKEVGFSYDDLQKIVEYPETARRAGIEGQVIVQAYIGKDGKVKKTQIKFSDNKYLNEAAESAIKKFDQFTPAIQNKQPVAVWISIPIKFKIK